MRSLVIKAEKKCSAYPTRQTSPRATTPNQHDPFASAWNMLPAGSAAKRDAVKDATIWTTVSGSVGVVICKRYAQSYPTRHITTTSASKTPAEGIQVEEDPEDFGTQGKKFRVKKEKEGKSRKTYRGQAASTLYLQTYQLILWKQSHTLVHDHGFPEQFESLVRDLWAFRLETLKSRIDETTDDEDNHEPELFSSQPSQTEDSDEEGFRIRSRFLEWPRLIDAVALCYLAAILMRLPVCVSDFHRLIVNQDIPYVRALRAVPKEMKEKLPPEFVAILDISRIPKVEDLHRGFLDVVLHYRHRFGITLPALNTPLILYRHIKRLAIPVEVYEVTKKLQELLGFTYEYPKRLFKHERKNSFHLPEVQLMVLVVISTKLLFPFDGIARYPVSAKEPSSHAVNWQVWVRAQRHYEKQKHAGGKIGKADIIQLTDNAVLDMEPSQLDEYMDWYEKDWLDSSKGPSALAEMFLITRPENEVQSNPGPAPASGTEEDGTEAALTTLLQTVMQDMVPTQVVPAQPGEEKEEEKKEEGEEEEVQEEQEHGYTRPGYWYHRYRWESALPETARAFYELAAQLAGISLSMLIRAVSLAEFRIAKWHENQRRAEFIQQFGAEAGNEDVDAMDELDEQLFDLGVEDEG